MNANFNSSVCSGLAALMLALASGCSKSPNAGAPGKSDRAAATPVTVATVMLLPLDRTLPVVGTLFAKEEATIAARVEGQIERTHVDLGDRVTTGQELVLIDTTSYEAFARQAAANLARSQASALNAAQNLKRAQELRKNNVASESELDQATAEAAQSQAEVKAAEATEAIARLNLDRSRVKAPFAAAVAERLVNAGDYVKIAEPLFRLVNDTELKLVGQVPERYAGRARIGQPVRFTVDAQPGETFEGRVYLVSPAVNTSTRSFTVAAEVPNADGRLKASTFARGELLLEKNVPTPVVPLEAVINFAGVTKVFVVETNVAHAREVQIGRVREGRQEILSGLNEGETVVVTGQTKLYEGASVRVLEASPKTETRPAKE
jgi:membrane fusion protein (multidrug efflux system)